MIGWREHERILSGGHPLLLDVGTQAEDVLLARHLELVGEPEVFHLNLDVEQMDPYGFKTLISTLTNRITMNNNTTENTDQLEVCDAH